MNTRLMAAAMAAMMGTSAIGVALAGSIMNMTVNATGTSMAGIQSIAAPVANSSTVAYPQSCTGGWCYLAKADPTKWGVVSNSYYQSAFYDVAQGTYFFFA